MREEGVVEGYVWIVLSWNSRVCIGRMPEGFLFCDEAGTYAMKQEHFVRKQEGVKQMLLLQSKAALSKT